MTDREYKKYLKKSLESLTPKEREVLRYFKEGFSNPEIADIMGITNHTVKKVHMSNIYSKFGVPGERRGKNAYLLASLWKYDLGV